MYGLSVGLVPRAGRSISWYDLSVANNVFVKNFNPFSYNTRNSDSQKVFAHGGYTSAHYVNPKESVLELTVYGTQPEIRAVFAKFPPNRNLVFRWYEEVSETTVQYFYGKAVGTQTQVASGQLTGSDQDWVDANIRIMSVDPFVYGAHPVGTFRGDTSPSINDTFSFLTEPSTTSNDMEFTSTSTIEHPPQFLRLTAPTVDNETLRHTLTIPETGTSCSVTFAGTGNDMTYTLWSRFGEELRLEFVESGTPMVVDDQIWDGGVPLIPAGGTYHLEHTVEVLVPAGVTDPSSRIVVRDPNDTSATFMSFWVHRLGRAV